FEISTDKIDTEIPSPASGVLQDILVKEGQTVQINTVVAIIGDGSGKPAKEEPAPPKQEARPKEPAQQTKKEEPKPVKGPAPVAGPAPEAEPVGAVRDRPQEEKEEKAEEQEPSSTGERIKSSPLVRRIAKENNVDLAALSG